MPREAAFFYRLEKFFGLKSACPGVCDLQERDELENGRRAARLTWVMGNCFGSSYWLDSQGQETLIEMIESARDSNL